MITNQERKFVITITFMLIIIVIMNFIHFVFEIGRKIMEI